jgi:D-sedoheptulose 7-phosphate isomerase
MNKNFLKYKEALDNLLKEEEFLKFKKVFNKYKKIILLGNGGSNSITSHISQDYVKFCNKKCYCMSDPSMLTCFSNDFGVENIFNKYLEFYGDKQTLIIIISSSGNSENILKAIKYCEKNTLPYGILTGFNSNNKAIKISKHALWKYNIPIENYGVVECIHQIFLHGVI